MAEFSNPQGTKIYFTISEDVNKAFDALLRYNGRDKLDIFIKEWMDEYDRAADYSIPDSQKTTISLDISDFDDSVRGEILAWGRFIMRQDTFFEFMVRKYCIETLKKLNNIFGIAMTPRADATNSSGNTLKHMSHDEEKFAIFLKTQKRTMLSSNATTNYICNARAIKNEYDIDLYSIKDISTAQELVRRFMPNGQYSEFNKKRAGAPRALTTAYIEYLEYLQSHQ